MQQTPQEADLDQNKTEQFQKEMQAIIAGEQDAPNKTIGHFAARFKETQARHDEIAKSITELEQKMSQGKVELAKTMGFLENLAQDLRHLWDEAQDGPSESPGEILQGKPV